MIPWKIDNEVIDVVQENDHLDLVVYGDHEEVKNVDMRIKKGRNSLFGMLGPALSQKCLISPHAKMHLFGLYTCPITRSRLGSMALRDNILSSLDLFHRNCLRSFLSLSSRSPIPALHFLLSEMPMSAKIHRYLFSIFTVYGVTKTQNCIKLSSIYLKRHQSIVEHGPSMLRILLFSMEFLIS